MGLYHHLVDLLLVQGSTVRARSLAVSVHHAGSFYVTFKIIREGETELVPFSGPLGG